MEDVLAVYSRTYSADYPVVCMDEKPLQLLSDARKSIPISKGNPVRYDSEYVIRIPNKLKTRICVKIVNHGF